MYRLKRGRRTKSRETLAFKGKVELEELEEEAEEEEPERRKKFQQHVVPGTSQEQHIRRKRK